MYDVNKQKRWWMCIRLTLTRTPMLRYLLVERRDVRSQHSVWDIYVAVRTRRNETDSSSFSQQTARCKPTYTIRPPQSHKNIYTAARQLMSITGLPIIGEANSDRVHRKWIPLTLSRLVDAVRSKRNNFHVVDVLPTQCTSVSVFCVALWTNTDSLQQTTRHSSSDKQLSGAK
jgi:hypothetical protein